MKDLMIKSVVQSRHQIDCPIQGYAVSRQLCINELPCLVEALGHHYLMVVCRRKFNKPNQFKSAVYKLIEQFDQPLYEALCKDQFYDCLVLYNKWLEEKGYLMRVGILLYSGGDLDTLGYDIKTINAFMVIYKQHIQCVPFNSVQYMLAKREKDMAYRKKTHLRKIKEYQDKREKKMHIPYDRDKPFILNSNYSMYKRAIESKSCKTNACIAKL